MRIQINLYSRSESMRQKIFGVKSPASASILALSPIDHFGPRCSIAEGRKENL